MRTLHSSPAAPSNAVRHGGPVSPYIHRGDWPVLLSFAQKASRETMMAERRNQIIIGAAIVAALLTAYSFGYLGVW